MNAKELGAMSAAPLMPPLHEASGQSASGYPYPEAGLTKREAFAMAAMQGMSLKDAGQFSQSDSIEGRHFKWAASAAVRYADALLAELAKDQA